MAHVVISALILLCVELLILFTALFFLDGAGGAYSYEAVGCPRDRLRHRRIASAHADGAGAAFMLRRSRQNKAAPVSSYLHL